MSATVHALAVEAVEQLTDDAVAITFAVPPELADAYVFRAGQHVSIRTGRAGDEVRRSYSICAPPSSRRIRIGVKRLPGGAFSEGVVPELRVGDVLDVMTPTGRFTVDVDPTARRTYVAVGAGSGITPVLSIVAAVLEGEPLSSVVLVCADRTHDSAMFVDDVHDLKDRFPTRLSLLHVLSRETDGPPLLCGRLDGDRLLRLLAAVAPVGEVDAFFLCGPQAMVTDLRAALLGAGATPGTVHTELFHADPPPRRTPTPGTRPAGAEGAARVTVRLGGRSSDVEVAPDGVPVLDAALRVRGDLPFACRGGVCGTCRAKVVEGTVVMDTNWALEADEVAAGFVLLCQAHPTSPRVVLDADA